MSTRRIAAWIGALSLAGLGLVAVAGIVALRYLDAGHLGRVITAAGRPSSPALISFSAGSAEGSSPQGSPADQAPDSADSSTDPHAAARRDCLEILAQGHGQGEAHMLLRPAVAGALRLPGVSIVVEGGPTEGMHRGPLELA